MRKFATFITCVLILVGASGMFVQVIPNPGHEVTGCSYPRDPDLGCAHPRDYTDCADCCRGGATCCACCPRVRGRDRALCKAACRDTWGYACDA